MTYLLLASLILLTGCTTYRPRGPRPLLVYNTRVNQDLSSVHWLDAYDTAPTVAARNHILSEFIWSVDHSYNAFETSFYSNKAAEDIGADVIGLGLGGATTLTGSAHAKTILALAASTIVGAKASVDAHWYDQQTRAALVAEMRALRAAQLLIIVGGMKKDLSGYTLDHGIVDIQRYYEAGSVSSALQEITGSANSQASAATAAVKAAE